MHGDEESPEEDHDGHVFCDWKVLESQCVGDLRNQDTQIKEGGEVVELLIGEVVVWEETENGRNANGVFVHELDCVVIIIECAAGFEQEVRDVTYGCIGEREVGGYDGRACF